MDPLAFQYSKGVQKGDPLGPLLSSLVLVDFMDSIDVPSNISFQLSHFSDIYLLLNPRSDGPFVGTRSTVAELLKFSYT